MLFAKLFRSFEFRNQTLLFVVFSSVFPASLLSLGEKETSSRDLCPQNAWLTLIDHNFRTFWILDAYNILLFTQSFKHTIQKSKNSPHKNIGKLAQIQAFCSTAVFASFSANVLLQQKNIAVETELYHNHLYPPNFWCTNLWTGCGWRILGGSWVPWPGLVVFVGNKTRRSLEDHPIE